MMVQLGEIFCYGTQTHHLVLLIFEGFNKNCSLKKKKQKTKKTKVLSQLDLKTLELS